MSAVSKTGSARAGPGDEKVTDAAGHSFFVRSVGNGPTVLLLGWLGAKDRYLAKYSDLYEELGVNSVRVTTFDMDCFFGWEANAAMVVKGIQLAKAQSNGNAVLVHAFSNGGASGISALFSQVNAERASGSDVADSAASAAVDAVATWVYDSCPAFLVRGTAGRALATATPNPVLAWVVEGVLNATLDVATACCKPNAQMDFWAPFQCPPTAAPTVYVYSASDTLTSASYLDDLVPARRAAGAAVHVVKLEDSPHVTHLRTHPALYRAITATAVAVAKGEGEEAEAAAGAITAHPAARALSLPKGAAAWAGSTWVQAAGPAGELNVFWPAGAGDITTSAKL